MSVSQIAKSFGIKEQKGSIDYATFRGYNYNMTPEEVEYITTTKVVTKDSIVFVLKDSCFNYSDKWVDFYANIPDSTFTYEVRDSLSSAISRIYKHRFLWWRWGTKGYKQTIVNHNPRSKIVYNEIVKVEH